MCRIPPGRRAPINASKPSKPNECWQSDFTHCRLTDGRDVTLLAQDFNVTIVHATTGQILRELTLNPDRDYQPLKPPPGHDETPEP